MDRTLTLLTIYLALCLPALTVQSGVADNWASIQQRFDSPSSSEENSSEEEEKSLGRRFWNDDLEPCIMKYCLRHPMETRLYMKCLRRHCPSGLVTVPRDLENEINKMLNEEDTGTEAASGGLWQGMLVEEEQGKVNRVCAKLYCGYMKAGAVRAQCERSTCSVNRLADTGSNMNAMADTSASFWKWLATRARAGAEKLAVTEEGGDLCGLVMCSGRHGERLIACVEQRCASPALSSPSSSSSSSSSSAAKSRGFARDDVPSTSGGEADGDRMDRSADRTLKRKRRINDDVSQCIQSYCGRQGSRTARLACIVRSCHRSG